MFGKRNYTANDIANWFLNENRIKINFEDSEYITNLKLQKLLYYAQGCYLAKYDKCLFKDEFVAWDHGPVIKAIYEKYKKNGSTGIRYDEDYDDILDEDTKDFLRSVYDRFGQYTAWKLRDMTHQERPWKETVRNGIISKDLIKEYFKENGEYANI